MRILSWNINGIRTLPQYHPWNTLKSCEEILDHLGADIICFQEMKASRSTLERNVGLPDHYHSFFSFPANKGGYSGVAVYTNSRTVVPLKAEEGLSGQLQPKPPLSTDERISTSYPSTLDIDFVPDAQGNEPTDLVSLDSEGRALVLDLGLFVLINLYCPNEASDERLPFKMNYHLMLEARVKKLLEEGREVIVLGDINICATPLDHGEGHLASRASGFFDHPARTWLRKWLEPEGPMTDVIRTFWPERKGMYTCWNTKIQARETNYGARIDYILSTRGLLPWFKHGDIQASLKGSDHCPIYVDLHDEITLPSGETLKLRDALRMTDPPLDAPRLAAKYWDEYSNKQTLLSTFFGKRNSMSIPSDPVDAPTLPNSPLASSSQVSDTPTQPSSFEDPPPSLFSPPSSQSARISHPTPGASSTSTSQPLHKRKSDVAEIPRAKLKKQKSGQSKLSSFFVKPAALPKATPKAKAELAATSSAESDSGDYKQSRRQSEPADSPVETPVHDTSVVSCEPCRDSLARPSPSASKAAWSQLLAPVKPPKCSVHGEPTKKYTVNKPGPNKGRTFFICSRPVGPGYDKGRSERLREEVDPTYRCNFFQWASDVKRESIKKDAKPG